MTFQPCADNNRERGRAALARCKIPIMTNPSRRYIAIWYDLAKAEVGARQRGWSDNRQLTLHDSLDIEEALSRSQAFPTSHDARLHLQQVIGDDDL
jgi:hypothetical protein